MRPQRLGYPHARPQQSSAQEWAAPKASPRFCCTKSLSCLQSHLPTLTPASGGPLRAPPHRALPVLFPLPRLREFLDSQLHSVSAPTVSAHTGDQRWCRCGLGPSSNPQPQPPPHSRVPSKRVAMVSRKVFCGASNPFMTGMALGRGFEARRWGAFRAARPEGARCRRGRGAPCARLPLPLPLGAAASAFLLRTPKLSALDLAPPRRTPSPLPTGQVLSPGLGLRPPRGPARGGAAGNTFNSLGVPPLGERTRRFVPVENSGHAHLESGPGRGGT